MKYQQKSFTVPASAGDIETCREVGHAFADRKGKCVRCGSRIRFADGSWEVITATPLPSPQAWRDVHAVAEQKRARRK